jgi:hypothetical protein
VICSAVPGGVAAVACVGEQAVDRELSVALPAITTVCDGDFAADGEFAGYTLQILVLSTWCGDKWVSNDDSCSAIPSTTTDGVQICVSEYQCESMCTASLPSLTVTSMGQNVAECTYLVEEPTVPPTEPAPTPPPTPPLTAHGASAVDSIADAASD